MACYLYHILSGGDNRNDRDIPDHPKAPTDDNGNRGGHCGSYVYFKCNGSLVECGFNESADHVSYRARYNSSNWKVCNDEVEHDAKDTGNSKPAKCWFYSD